MVEVKRLAWVDLIRFLAIFFVVFIHSQLTANYNPENWLQLIPYVTAQTCVGLFVLISGAMLLGKKESVKDFFMKRSVKVLLPWIAWTLIYMTWNYFYLDYRVSSFTDLLKFFRITFMTQLWFLPMIFTLYLLTPFLRSLVRTVPRVLPYLFIMVWFIFVCLLPLSNPSVSYPIWVQFVGYYVAGYYLLQLKPSRRVVWASGIIAVTSLAATIILGSQFYSQISPTIIVLSCSLFVVIRGLLEGLDVNRSVRNIVVFLGKVSFGVYLAHLIILQLFRSYMNIPSSEQNFLIPTLITTIVVFALSSVVVYCLQKVPYLKQIVP